MENQMMLVFPVWRDNAEVWRISGGGWVLFGEDEVMVEVWRIRGSGGS